MGEKYLLDSNIFINAYNLHYHPSYCESFWAWLHNAHQLGCFHSIDKVKEELIKPVGSLDELSQSLRAQMVPDEFFISSLTDPEVIPNYAQLIAWAARHNHYNKEAKETFSDSKYADAPLIATAMTYGYSIVTAEKSSPQSQKSIKIPDAANAHQVKCYTLNEILRRHAKHNFSFSH